MFILLLCYLLLECERFVKAVLLLIVVS